MTPDAYAITRDSAQAVANSIRFTRRFSRESANNTPTPATSFAASESPVWALRVTGSPITVDAETGEESSSGDAVKLYPAVWLSPNDIATGLEEQDEVWLLPLAGFEPKDGAEVLARFAGYRPTDQKSVFVGGVQITSGLTFHGQDSSTPGTVMIWHDDTGQWAGSAHNFRYETIAPFGGKGRSTSIRIGESLSPLNLAFGQSSSPDAYCQLLTIQNVDTALNTRQAALTLSTGGFDGMFIQAFASADDATCTLVRFTFNQNGNSPALQVSRIDSSNSKMINSGTNLQIWLKHYSSDGSAGISGTRTVKDGAGANQTVTIKDGIITGWTT